MAKRILFLGVVLLASALASCGSSSTAGSSEQHDTGVIASRAPEGTKDSTVATAPVTLPVQPNSTPQDVVMAFLNAMRDGNSGITAGLLTVKAQEETVRHNWPVQPPGAPTATYQLGQPTYLDQQQTATQIPCVWSESDGAGGKIQFEVTWMLRRQDNGWRIAGFASEIVPGRPAYYFNFEDIANLKAAQSEAEEALVELARAQSPAASVGENPAGNSTRR